MATFVPSLVDFDLPGLVRASILVPRRRGAPASAAEAERRRSMPAALPRTAAHLPIELCGRSWLESYLQPAITTRASRKVKWISPLRGSSRSSPLKLSM